MDIIIILAITAFVAIYITLPFFMKGRQVRLPIEDIEVQDPISDRLSALNNQKENLYSAIKDIEFDYGLGKLSKDDYEELNLKYKNEAASVLREIDKIETEPENKSLEDEIEKEISAFRKSHVTSDAEIEAEISAFRTQRTDGDKCRECGAQYSEDDVFCSKCGAKI